MVLFVLLTAVAYTVWLERKVVGRMQNRWGPTRIGPFGLLQPLADGIKFLFQRRPDAAARRQAAVHCRARHRGHVRADLDFGDSFRRSTVELAATRPLQIARRQHRPAGDPRHHVGRRLRHRARRLVLEQQIFPARLAARHGARSATSSRLGLSLVGVWSLSGGFSLRDIVNSQRGTSLGFIPGWNIFRGQFIGFFIYLMAAYAETNRIPFDLPEAETELVAGYHTEYSSMKFAMFFMAEYANMITVACLATLLFFGGWHGPLSARRPAGDPAGLLVCVKVFGFLFFYIWVRGTLPRFRYDQLMAFGWKVLLPLSLVNLIATAIGVAW